MPVAVTRLLDEPIIRPNMDARIGDNINGPSLIRVPNWVEGRLGRYYLYFAAHKGAYIRLAYADALTGPWTLHTPGVLDVAESLFEPVDPPEPPEADRPPWAGQLKGGYLYAHVASPDVHVDHGDRRIRMYYHGLLWNGDQQTRLATSRDGVTFEPLEPLLGPPYFRAFAYGNHVYALVTGGGLRRALRWQGAVRVRAKYHGLGRRRRDRPGLRARRGASAGGQAARLLQPRRRGAVKHPPRRARPDASLDRLDAARPGHRS